MSSHLLNWDIPSRIGGDAIYLLRRGTSLARKVIHEFIDDIDGGEATDTVKFSYRGADYEVDLSKKNAAKLDKALAPYLEAGRRVKGTRSTRGAAAKAVAPGRKAATGASSNAKDVREWAKSEGIDVSDRGRVPADITRRYQEAHGI
jgi:hypothetical protein